MTEEEKKALTQAYGNTCAQLGETILAIELSEASIIELKAKAKDLLKQIKEIK